MLCTNLQILSKINQNILGVGCTWSKLELIKQEVWGQGHKTSQHLACLSLCFISQVWWRNWTVVSNDSISNRLFKIASTKHSLNFVIVPKCHSYYIGGKLNIWYFYFLQTFCSFQLPHWLPNYCFAPCLPTMRSHGM